MNKFLEKLICEISDALNGQPLAVIAAEFQGRTKWGKKSTETLTSMESWAEANLCSGGVLDSKRIRAALAGFAATCDSWKLIDHLNMYKTPQHAAWGILMYSWAEARAAEVRKGKGVPELKLGEWYESNATGERVMVGAFSRRSYPVTVQCKSKEGDWRTVGTVYFPEVRLGGRQAALNNAACAVREFVNGYGLENDFDGLLRGDWYKHRALCDTPQGRIVSAEEIALFAKESKSRLQEQLESCAKSDIGRMKTKLETARALEGAGCVYINHYSSSSSGYMEFADTVTRRVFQVRLSDHMPSEFYAEPEILVWDGDENPAGTAVKKLLAWRERISNQ